MANAAHEMHIDAQHRHLYDSLMMGGRRRHIADRPAGRRTCTPPSESDGVGAQHEFTARAPFFCGAISRRPALKRATIRRYRDFRQSFRHHHEHQAAFSRAQHRHSRASMMGIGAFASLDDGVFSSSLSLPHISTPGPLSAAAKWRRPLASATPRASILLYVYQRRSQVTTAVIPRPAMRATASLSRRQLIHRPDHRSRLPTARMTRAARVEIASARLPADNIRDADLFFAEF